MLPFKAIELLTPKIQHVPMHKKLHPIQLLHPEHGSCLSCQLLCLLEWCAPNQSIVQRFPLQVLHHVQRPPLWYLVMMNSSVHAYMLLKANMLHWLLKWLCHRIMQRYEYPIVPILNKYRTLLTFNHYIKAHFKGIHPQPPSKQFPPLFHPVPPRGQSLQPPPNSRWVMLLHLSPI
jgi:hypothetical protein